jgi:malate dehydrogenase (oxaloacetate-decarboxylating)
LFKEFGGVDAFPICLGTQDTDAIIRTVKNIAPTFGGIVLKNIAAPRCFEIEKRLKEELDIPVYNDDGLGAAAVVGAAAINAFRLLKKPLSDVRAVVCGAGAAGSSVAKMLITIGVNDIIVCDSKGILSASRIPEFGEDKLELLEFTNKDGLSGDLFKALKGSNLFVGVSEPNILTGEMVRAMAKNPVIFALSDPEPEIMPDIAKTSGAGVIGTGFSEFPNHISNALLFPGLFRGVFDAGASEITEPMIVAAINAIAGLVPDEELSAEYILPSVFKEGVCAAVAKSVAEAWI